LDFLNFLLDVIFLAPAALPVAPAGSSKDGGAGFEAKPESFVSTLFFQAFSMESILFGVSLSAITFVQVSRLTVCLPNTRTWNGRCIKALQDTWLMGTLLFCCVACTHFFFSLAGAHNLWNTYLSPAAPDFMLQSFVKLYQFKDGAGGDPRQPLMLYIACGTDESKYAAQDMVLCMTVQNAQLVDLWYEVLVNEARLLALTAGALTGLFTAVRFYTEGHHFLFLPKVQPGADASVGYVLQRLLPSLAVDAVVQSASVTALVFGTKVAMARLKLLELVAHITYGCVAALCELLAVCTPFFWLSDLVPET
jgi:hypothetical protein